MLQINKTYLGHGGVHAIQSLVVKSIKYLSQNNKTKTMYIILVYDVGEKRVAKMLRLCRQYLNWIQNSVFEGEITDSKLKELLHKAKKIMDRQEDSIIVFKSREQKWLEKDIIGQEKNKLDTIL